MRVLLKESSDHTLRVMECTDACYDPTAREFYFYGTDSDLPGYEWVIKNISQSQSDSMIKELYEKGYADFSGHLSYDADKTDDEANDKKDTEKSESIFSSFDNPGESDSFLRVLTVVGILTLICCITFCGIDIMQATGNLPQDLTLFGIPV